MTVPSAGDWFQIYLCCVKPDGAQSTKASAPFQRTFVISMHNWNNWRQPSMRVTEYASDGASAEVCCRNHSVPHLSEDHCEVLSDVGASDPTATGSRHGHDGRPRSHRPVDECFPSSPGWCRSCVLTGRMWEGPLRSTIAAPSCPVHGFLDPVSRKSLW